MDASDRFDRGLGVRREVLGAEYVDASLANADDFMMPFQRLLTEWAWGDAWSRPGLDRRHTRGDGLGEFDLALGRRAVRRAGGGGALDGFDNRRMRVPEDRRAPRLHVVDVAVAVGVEEVRTFRAVDEERIAADRRERTHRRVDASRDDGLRALEPRGHVRRSASSRAK